MSNIEQVVGGLAAHWARLPEEERHSERYRKLMLAIEAAIQWLAPIAEPKRRPVTPAEAALIAEVRAKVDAAHNALAEACRRGRIRMCVPVQPDDDDVVIAAALDGLSRLCAALEQRT